MNGKRPGGWVALACRYWRDPKVVAVSVEAQLLYVNGLCYSGEQETDGNVPANVVGTLLPTSAQHRSNLRQVRGIKACSAELVRVGLWVKTDDGYAVPFDTWSRWQETAEQKSEQRRKHAAKVARYRARDRGTDSDTDQVSDLPSGVGVGAGVGHRPTTPDPRSPSGLEIEVDDPELDEVPMPADIAARFDAVTNVLARRFGNGQAGP